MIKQVLQSLAITITISCVLGYALAPLFSDWLHAFIFSVLLQLIGSYFYKDITLRNDAIQKEVILNERLEILSRNSVSFPCPCGDNTFDEIIYPGQENTFVCEKCNQELKVDVTFTPIVITKPLIADPLQTIKIL
jgi:hypothetical protein